MRKLWVLLIFVAMVGFLSTAAVAQVAEDPPRNPGAREYLFEVEDPISPWIRAKYPVRSGPDEPNDDPWVINEPLYTEQQRGNNINTSIASSQGLNSGGAAVAPTAMTGAGAILSAPRGSGSARSPHQDARRGLKKVIRQLG